MAIKKTWTNNRTGVEVTFSIEDDGKTIILSDYNTDKIHIVEENNSPRFKKDNPLREVLPVIVEYIDGPFVFYGMDLNVFLTTHKEYLESDYRLICNKIEILGSRTILTYEKKLIKKESNSSQKNLSQEGKYYLSKEKA